MSKPKCPKCKTVLMFFKTPPESKKNSFWKCLICGFIGHKTTTLCLRCKKNRVIKGKNFLYCIECNCFSLTTIINKKAGTEKPLPEGEKVKKNKIEISVSCPKCLNKLTTSLTKISKKPFWICTYWLCDWKALKTNKLCKRCRNFLSFSKNKFYCPFCKKPLFNINDLKDIQEEMKYFQEELDLELG